jgi:hypothetical protein
MRAVGLTSSYHVLLVGIDHAFNFPSVRGASLQSVAEFWKACETESTPRSNINLTMNRWGKEVFILLLLCCAVSRQMLCAGWWLLNCERSKVVRYVVCLSQLLNVKSFGSLSKMTPTLSTAKVLRAKCRWRPLVVVVVVVRQRLCVSTYFNKIGCQAVSRKKWHQSYL